MAIATVGDVMDLEGENRILVREGLQMLGRTSNLGLKALMECTGIDRRWVNAYHIGFVLGPCLNASGRLDTAKRALNLLRSKSEKRGGSFGRRSKALNDSRKDLTEVAVEQAKELVETTSLSKDRVLVIYLAGCHESLAGIVAGRIRECYHRPTFVLTDAEEGVKGSGRSIETYHMYEELSRCKELLTRYGGHKMAAGFSLESCNVEKFRRMLNECCTLTEEEMQEKVVIDMELPFSCVTEEFIEELSLLEPFGKGNTKPVFAVRNVELLGARILGKNRNVLKLLVRDGRGVSIDALCFRDAEHFLACVKERYGQKAEEELLAGRGRDIRMSLTYYPDLNEYQGQMTPQIVYYPFISK